MGRVLYWSSGLESTLLLAVMSERGEQFDIVQFRDGWTKRQKAYADRLIIEKNLKVFSYPPADRYFIGDGEQITLIDEYPAGGSVVPLVRDIVDGEQCLASLSQHRIFESPFKWEQHIVGSRKGDTHWTGQLVKSEKWMVGDAEFIAPLFDWSRQEVKDALIARGLNAEEADEQEDSGNISGCSACLTDKGEVFCPAAGTRIPTIKWSPQTNLKLFRERFGIDRSK